MAVRSVFAATLLLFLLHLLDGRCHTAAADEAWQPPAPNSSDKDWIHLSTGEWLPGEIQLMRDVDLEFDSEEFDDIVLDWADIVGLRSSRILTYVFTGERVVTGTAVMQDGVIRIDVGGVVSEFRRFELLSIIEGKAREIDYWSTRASIGITARAGNTEQADLNSIVRIKREAAQSRLNLMYQGNQGEVGGEETINNNRANADFNVFIKRGFFLTPAALEFYSDKFQNIDYRYLVAAGVGYFFLRGGKVDWYVQFGGGYRHTRFLSVEAGQDQTEKTGNIIPATTLEADITSDIELDFDYSSQIGVPDIKTTTHHTTALLTVDFFRDIFELSLSVTWDRVENPTPREDGSVPKRDDLRMAFGFAVDL